MSISETVDSPPAFELELKLWDHSDKHRLRKDAASKIRSHKTIVELNAGKGNIAKLYEGIGKRHILIDNDVEALKTAAENVKDVECFTADNLKWMAENLPNMDDVTLADFDPYGMSCEEVKQFFSCYKVKEPMVVSITDGVVVNTQPWFKWDIPGKYSVGDEETELERTTHYSEILPKLIAGMLEALGNKHGFKVEKINETWGGSGSSDSVYYCSYLLNPSSSKKDASDSWPRMVVWDSATLENKIISEDGESIVFPAVIAREIVQPYPDGIAYKPADELEKACDYAVLGSNGCLPVKYGAHPSPLNGYQGLLVDTGDINGRTENIRFVKNLVEPKTKRPMDRGIRCDVRFYKKLLSTSDLANLKGGSDKDVSVGFTFKEDPTPGEWRGTRYDYVQRSICLQHVAGGIPRGRCPFPLCGLGVDSSDSWEVTPIYIRSGHRRPEDFEPDSFRTVQISSGIKAVLACPVGAYVNGKCNTGTQIQSFLFERSKFSLVEAKTWFSKHEHDSITVEGCGGETKELNNIQAVREVTSDDGEVRCAKTGARADFWVALSKNCLDQLVETQAVDCPVCKELDRLGPIEFVKRIVASFSRDEVLKALNDAAAEEKKAQEERFKKHGIGIKKGGNVTKPGEFKDIQDDLFADPVNYRYPIDEKHVVAAWGTISKPENQKVGGYTDEEWAKISRKVEAAMKESGHKAGTGNRADAVKPPQDQVQRTQRLLATTKDT